MNHTSSVIKMHLKDKWTWLIIPWAILLGSFGINLVIASFVEDDIYTGGLASIYVYMLVAGIATVAQTFPFALGLSVRRTDYFAGTAGAVGLVSAATAILLLLFSMAERLTGAWGMGLHFFNVPYLTDGTAIDQLWIHFIALVHLCALGFVVASVYQRFGHIGLYIFFGALFILLSALALIATYYYWWGDVWRWLIQHSASELSVWLVPTTALYVLVSHGLLRKAEG